MTALRSGLFAIWMVIVTLLVGVLGAPSIALGRSAVRAVSTFWSRAILAGLAPICGLTWEVRGAPPAGRALVASKHQSMFETLALWAVLSRPIVIVKRELRWAPVFGWYLFAAGAIGVNRSAGAKALKDMLRAARARADDGGQVVIFPEGTRTPPGERGEFKPGAAALYTAMQADCAPVAVNSGLFWPAHGLTRRRGHIVVEFLDPIPPGLDRDAFMERLEDTIETASARLYDEGLAYVDAPPGRTPDAAHV